MGNCGCSNNNNCFGGLFSGNTQTWLWIIILLLLFCNSGCNGGCWNNGCGCD